MGLLRRRGSGLPRKYAKLLEEHQRRADEIVARLESDLLNSPKTFRYSYDGGERVETHETLSGVDSGRDLLSGPRDIGASVLVTAVHIATTAQNFRWSSAWQMLSSLVSKKLPLSADDVVLVFLLALRSTRRDQWFSDLMEMLMSLAEQYCQTGDVEEIEQVVRAALEAVDTGVDALYFGPPKVRTRMLALLPGLSASAADLFESRDNWGRAMNSHPLIDECPSELRSLLVHLIKAGSTPRPSAAWRKKCQALLQASTSTAELVRIMLEEARKAREQIKTYRIGPDTFQFPWLFTRSNKSILRGAAWAAVLLNAEWSPDILHDLGMRCAMGIGRVVDPVEMKVANSCIAALSEITPSEAIPRLLTLRSRVRHRTILKQIEQSLDNVASQAGVSKTEILESAISTMGLDLEGRKEIGIADITAVVSIAAPDRVNIQWRTSDGRTQTSAPKGIADSEGLRQFKLQVAALKEALRIERLRVEGLLSEEWRRPYRAWAERTLGHPLTRAFALTLIWVAWSDGNPRLGMPLDGRSFTDIDGTTFHPGEDDLIELWHPIFSEADEVRAWRRFILEREVRQPFKQVFREVYRLTPPELETAIYSNRFAAHILRYPQLYGLIKARGWFGNALGPWDGGYDATIKKNFDGRGIRAEFYVEQVQEDDQMGTLAQLCAADQVRFYSTRPPSQEPMPLTDIPPVVFSEAMRDVDLFVSVPSIAADPQWQDRGADRHVDYWRETSFGELHETAKMRREALEYLLPRLIIADKCTLSDKYLIVRGDLRTYKIHLGSGNILMEPNEQYLCIVPSRSRPGPDNTRFLPFEDDYLLSIILSKAFMLAADRKIKDQQILDQIRR